MGWNTSLTSIDVHQRLPCEGILWRKQEAVLTPYLGIWDKSTGGMENMMRTTGRRESHSSPDVDPRHQPAGAYMDSRPQECDVDHIGAFAYCVEATESMSRVTTYFLQQRINPHDPEAVNAWLARFKELDLRRVHWKMFLPQKWKPNVGEMASRMDPNLTLAHITHNASTILLHQLIAWPPRSWPFRKRLPSVWSAETCWSAGKEISTITLKYLENTPDALPLTSSFAFCVYIAARMMLIHWRHDVSNHRLDDFWSMTRALEEMSRRWRGVVNEMAVASRDLSAKYALTLREMHENCLKDETFQIQVADYTQEIDHRNPTLAGGSQYMYSDTTTVTNNQSQGLAHLDSQQQWAPGYPTLTERMAFENAAPTQPDSQTAASTVRFPSVNRSQIPLVSGGGDNSPDPTRMGPEQLMALDEYFTDMDRVIAFNDGSLFSAGLDGETY